MNYREYVCRIVPATISENHKAGVSYQVLKTVSTTMFHDFSDFLNRRRCEEEEPKKRPNYMQAT